jgi:hypothetical protein
VRFFSSRVLLGFLRKANPSTEYFDGIQSQDNEYGNMVLLPNQDGIQEFKMQASGRDATTGHTGGAAVNLVTKSGGNDFHGTAFEFFRNSDLDARNYVNPVEVPTGLLVSWSYELPFGKGRAFGKDWNGALDGIFGGWKFNSIDTFQSGSPFSVNSGTNTEGSGGGTQRANLVGNPSVPNPGPSLWFNPAAFAAPAAYTYGNSGRNILVGPGTNQIDLSLFKIIPLPWREGMRLEFRTEVFNLFNKPQFDNPNESGATAGAATIGVAGTGTLTYAGNPAFFQRTSREIQLAMKLYF